MNKTKEEMNQLIEKFVEFKIAGYKCGLVCFLNSIILDIKDGKIESIIPSDTDPELIRSLRQFGFSVNKCLDPDNFTPICKVGWKNIKKDGEINFSYPDEFIERFTEQGSLITHISSGLIFPVKVRTNYIAPEVSLTKI